MKSPIYTLIKESKKERDNTPQKTRHTLYRESLIPSSIHKARLQLLPPHHAQNGKNTGNPFSAKAALRILYAPQNY